MEEEHVQEGHSQLLNDGIAEKERDAENEENSKEEVDHSEYDSALDGATAYDQSDCKEELYGYLDNLKFIGSAWSKQDLTSFPNPGLHIHHLGLSI